MTLTPCIVFHGGRDPPAGDLTMLFGPWAIDVRLTGRQPFMDSGSKPPRSRPVGASAAGRPACRPGWLTSVGAGPLPDGAFEGETFPSEVPFDRPAPVVSAVRRPERPPG
jgi:hypothetical protein